MVDTLTERTKVLVIGTLEAERKEKYRDIIDFHVSVKSPKDHCVVSVISSLPCQHIHVLTPNCYVAHFT